MIPITDQSWQTLSWQDTLKSAIRHIDDLVSVLNLPPQPHFSNFPILVPAPYLSRIEKNNAMDPLLRQVLSSPQEIAEVKGFSKNPLQEDQYTQTNGLIKKYHGRVLIITTGACAINCRYCFRRHFEYESFQPDTSQWQVLLKEITDDDTINEVILSGGDPLMLPDRRLTWIVEQIERISHVHTLRIHSRMPVVIPQRINAELINWIKRTTLKVVLVNHINHPNEIDEQVREAFQKLKQADVTLLNQSVLLRHVNDQQETLKKLSHQLFSAGVLPYYLHALDPVAGASHFSVPDSKALALIEALRNSLPGYLVPKLVREVPGDEAKQPIR